MVKVNNPVIPNYTPKPDRKMEKAVELQFSKCCVCGGKIHYGYYGRWGDTGTCSRKCEQEMENKSIIKNTEFL